MEWEGIRKLYSSVILKYDLELTPVYPFNTTGIKVGKLDGIVELLTCNIAQCIFLQTCSVIHIAAFQYLESKTKDRGISFLVWA